jgi:hypothetical protein
MKIYVLISATALPGKLVEAGKAVSETVRYLRGNSHYVGEYEIVRPINGPNNRLHWLCRYQSMADQEKDVELRGKDPEWSKVFAGVSETVDVDNITSQIFRVTEQMGT